MTLSQFWGEPITRSYYVDLRCRAIPNNNICSIFFRNIFIDSYKRPLYHNETFENGTLTACNVPRDGSLELGSQELMVVRFSHMANICIVHTDCHGLGVCPCL